MFFNHYTLIQSVCDELRIYSELHQQRTKKVDDVNVQQANTENDFGSGSSSFDSLLLSQGFEAAARTVSPDLDHKSLEDWIEFVSTQNTKQQSMNMARRVSDLVGEW